MEAPAWCGCWIRTNPLLLTKDGEFILKNLVLLAAGLAVGGEAYREGEKNQALS
jgi:hypothetical protein